jgi:TatD DNase family protein
MVAIGGSDEANALVYQTVKAHSEVMSCTAGYDRDLCTTWNGDVEPVRTLLAQPEVVAVGECGIDYFHKENPPENQKKLFAAMLDLAIEFQKPVIVHSREADEDTLAMLREFSNRWPVSDRPCAVLHCFTGSKTFAHALLDLNLMISFSGILTFKSAADLREVAATIPDDRLLIETDSPYLAPVPHRGKRNEPAFVPHVAECLAELRGVSAEDIGNLTTQNAKHFFGI